jgi:hypothetical protein
MNQIPPKCWSGQILTYFNGTVDKPSPLNPKEWDLASPVRLIARLIAGIAAGIFGGAFGFFRHIGGALILFSKEMGKYSTISEVL